MKLDFRHIKVLDDTTAEFLRGKEPWERFAIGVAIWRDTRNALTTNVRITHPDWTEAQIRDEVNKRMCDQVVWFSDSANTANATPK
jgi:hypothetical protein